MVPACTATPSSLRIYALPLLASAPSPQLSGKRAAVVGRSNIVGMPAALLLQREDATVTVIHSRTPDAQRICSEVRSSWLTQCYNDGLWAGCTLVGTELVGWWALLAAVPSHARCWHQHARLQVCAYSQTHPSHPCPCQADIIIAACGKAEMVEGDWVKEGAAVIDVGINAVDGARLVAAEGGGTWVAAWVAAWVHQIAA